MKSYIQISAQQIVNQIRNLKTINKKKKKEMNLKKGVEDLPAAAHQAKAQRRPNPAARYRFVIVFLGSTSSSVELAPSPDAPTADGRPKIRTATLAAYKRTVRRQKTLGRHLLPLSRSSLQVPPEP
jgi:hypothetical protein